MPAFSLRISAHSVRDARLLLEDAVDLINSESIGPGEEKMLRVDGYGDNKSSMALLTMYSERLGLT